MTDPVSTRERPIRDGPTPTVSIVVAWRESTGLDEFLAELTRVVDVEASELLVVTPHEEARTRVRELYADVRILRADGDLGYEALRRLGFASAVGDIVFFTDDRRPEVPTNLPGTPEATTDATEPAPLEARTDR